MLKTKTCAVRLQTIYLLALLVAVTDPIAAKERTYATNSCPVTFVVPIDLELHDVVGWTDPNEKIACRISVVRKNRGKTLSLDKSFDDVRDKSDIVLDVKYISMISRLNELNFSLLHDQVLYRGETLSSDAKAMGYEAMKIRPVEHYPVGHGDLYVGIQDFARTGKKMISNRSVSYVFILGNKKYCIDVEITYDRDGYSNKIKQGSILRLLRSANFVSDAENSGKSAHHE